MSTKGSFVNALKNGDRKLWWILAAIILVVAIIVGIFVAALTSEKTVMNVNGEAIKEEEFSFYLRQHRSDIVTRYTAGQGLTYDDAFWDTTAEDGSTPLAAWIDAAVEECAHNNAIRQAAKEAGLTDFTSFSDWKADLEKENKRRADAVKNGEVIYGPERYELDSYIQITLANLEEDLKKAFREEYTATEEEMRAYYDENLANFKEQDLRLIQQISIPYGEGKIDAETAMKKAEEIHAALLNGESVRTIMTQYADCAEMTDKEYNHGRAEWGDSMMAPQTYSNAVSLAVGQISAITDENSTVYISICTELFPGQYQPYEESTTFIAEKLLDRNFEEHLDGMLESTVVERDEEMLKKVANGQKN